MIHFKQSLHCIPRVAAWNEFNNTCVVIFTLLFYLHFVQYIAMNILFLMNKKKIYLIESGILSSTYIQLVFLRPTTEYCNELLCFFSILRFILSAMLEINNLPVIPTPVQTAKDGYSPDEFQTF